VLETRGALAEHQMERRARIRGTLALVRSTGGSARTEGVNRALNAAFNIRKCTVLTERPAKLTRYKFVGQSLGLEEYPHKT